MIRWWKRRKRVVPPQVTPGIERAREALGEARVHGLEQHRAAGEARRLEASFRELQARNRFGSRLEAAYRAQR